MSEIGSLLEQLITAPYSMRLGLAKQVASHFEATEVSSHALEASRDRALCLLARAQDASPKTPREANAHSVQLDDDIGRLLQSEGFVWDAIRRRWTSAEGRPSVDARVIEAQVRALTEALAEERRISAALRADVFRLTAEIDSFEQACSALTGGHGGAS